MGNLGGGYSGILCAILETFLHDIMANEKIKDYSLSYQILKVLKPQFILYDQLLLATGKLST